MVENISGASFLRIGLRLWDARVVRRENKIDGIFTFESTVLLRWWGVIVKIGDGMVRVVYGTFY